MYLGKAQDIQEIWVKTETYHTRPLSTGEVPIVRQTCGTKKNDDVQLRSLAPKFFLLQSRYTPWRRLGGEEV
jgi:hypothetical protein